MGYESKLFVVEKGGLYDERIDKSYAKIIAIYDMCKCPTIAELFSDISRETKHYIFADDGNTVITEDKYKKSLLEADVDEVLDCIETEMETDDYRRYRPLYGMLKAIQDSITEWPNVAVLHYGH